MALNGATWSDHDDWQCHAAHDHSHTELQLKSELDPKVICTEQALTPLDYPGLHHSFQHQKQKLPFSWILAQEVMWEINLPFKATDLWYILQGDISLSHLYHVSLSLSPPNTLPVISTHIFTNFQRNGFSTLHQFGRWVLNDQTFLPTHFLPSHPHFPSSMYYLTRDWPLISHWLSLLHSIILPLTKPSPTLLLPKPLRQAFAETVLLSLPSLSQTYTHSTPLHLYASDTSMTCHNPDNHPSITFAVVTHQKAFAGSLSKFGHSANILHGEVYGIVVASLLMQKMLQGPTIHPSPILYTNHLNSINILSSHIPYPHQMSSNPARSLYRWIFDIRQRTEGVRTDIEETTAGIDGRGNEETVVFPFANHVRAHTSSLSIPSQLNRLADTIASHPNTHNFPPPSVPLPTFFMDYYTPFHPQDGYIEQKLSTYVDQQLASSQASQLCTLHQPILLPHLYDTHPPPDYPYTRAIHIWQWS